MVAAVLGRDIPLSLLEALWEGQGGLEPHLLELKHREFLYQPTRAGEPTYVFKHPLIQEVAYAALALCDPRAKGVNGQALAIDIGDAKDIHPRNKQEVGRRLALLAVSLLYQRFVFRRPQSAATWTG